MDFKSYRSDSPRVAGAITYTLPKSGLTMPITKMISIINEKLAERKRDINTLVLNAGVVRDRRLPDLERITKDTGLTIMTDAHIGKDEFILVFVTPELED